MSPVSDSDSVSCRPAPPLTSEVALYRLSTVPVSALCPLVTEPSSAVESVGEVRSVSVSSSGSPDSCGVTLSSGASAAGGASAP